MNTSMITTYKETCNAINSQNKKKIYYRPRRSNNMDQTTVMSVVLSCYSIISVCVILSVAMTLSHGETKNTLLYVATIIFVIKIIIISSVSHGFEKTYDTIDYDCIDNKNMKENEYTII